MHTTHGNPSAAPGRRRQAGAPARRPLAGALALALVCGGASAATFDASSEAELSQAIQAANALAGTDVVNVTADITLSAALPAITDRLVLRASGARRALRRDDSGVQACAPDAANAFRLIDASADLTLQNVALSGGCNLVDQGGAVRVQNAELRIENSVVSGNQTFVENPNYYYGRGGIGGGVAVLYGRLTVVDSTISGNASHGNLAGGGGATAYVSDLAVVRSTISGNTSNGAGAFGGGIYAIGDYANAVTRNATISDSVFENNAINGEYAYGGGLGAFAAVTTISRSRFNANSAGGGYGARGAGINVQNGPTPAAVTTIDHCTIAGNTIDAYNGWGAGLRIGGGIARIDATTIAGNSVAGVNRARAGAIWFEHADARLTNVTISGNSAAAALVGGGALGVDSEAPDPMRLVVANSTIADNAAVGGRGGAIWMKSESDDATPSDVVLISTILAGNEGAGGLDDIAAANSTPTVAAQRSLIQGGVDVGAGSFAPDATTQALAGRDPLLAPLADNGGPTATRALLAGSPAVDAGGDPLQLVFDQRGAGHPRKVGPAVDIGAYERKPGPRP